MTAQVRRIAVIINGDTEGDTQEKHHQNVQRALRVLDGAYETFVASTRQTASDHFYSATKEDILRMLSDVQRASDSNTEIVIYTTGHGKLEEEVARLCIRDECVADPIATALDRISYGKRTVIMDQCYGGNWSRLFLNDPKTLFISAGSRDDVTCCARFTPFFWADDVTDLNGDGLIGWRERFANAVSSGGSVFSQYLSSAGYADEGAPTFGTTVGEVSNRAGLEQELAKLGSGQYAVVFFSAPWCGFCREFKPKFARIAAEANGQHLFLTTENENLAKQYNITAFPTLMIIGNDGTQYVVSNPNDVLNEMTQVYLSDEQKVDIILERISDPNVEVRKGVLMACQALLMRGHLSHVDADRIASVVRQLMGDDRLSYAAIDIYRRLSSRGMSGAEAEMGAAALRGLFFHGKPYISLAAVQAYQSLADKISPQESLQGAIALRQVIAAPVRGNPEEYYNELLKGSARYGMSPQRISEIRQIFARGNPIAEAATWTYFNLVEARHLPQEEIDEAAVFFRNIFTDMEKSDIERKAAADVYQEMAHYVSETEARLAAPVIRGFFHDRFEDVETSAMLSYGSFVEKLTLEEAAIGAREIRAFLNDPGRSNASFALMAYGAIARKGMMPADEINIGAPMLREMFTDENRNPNIRIQAIQTYQHLAGGISTAEASAVCPLVRELAKNYDSRLQKMAAIVYEKAIQRLPLEDKRVEAKILRESIRNVDDRYFEAYVSLLNSMPADELEGEAAVLRNMFGVSYTARDIAVKAYLGLIKGISADEVSAIDEIAASLRPLFLNDSAPVREAAIDVYGAISEKVSSNESMEGARALRAAFGDSDIYDHAVKAYVRLAKRFEERQAIEEAYAIRPLFGAPLKYFEKTALVTAYGAIADKLPADDTIIDAPAIREFFTDPLSRDAAFDTYKAMASRLPADELLEGAAAVRSFFGTNLYFNYQRVYTYVGIVANLRGDELRQEMEALKSVFSSAGDARYEAVMAYVMLVESLPEDEVGNKDEILNSLFTDPEIGQYARRDHGYVSAAKWLADSLVSVLGHIVG